MLIAPERKPHRARTDLAVSEGYLVVAKCEIQTSDKHDFFVYHIFHIAARPAALVETGEAAAALSRFIDYFLSYVARHRFFNPAGFLLAPTSPEFTIVITPSRCSQVIATPVVSPGLEGARAYLLLNRRRIAFKRARRRSHHAERGRRRAGGSEQSRYPPFHRLGVLDIRPAEALHQFGFIAANAKVKPNGDCAGDEGSEPRLESQGQSHKIDQMS